MDEEEIFCIILLSWYYTHMITVPNQDITRKIKVTDIPDNYRQG